MQPARWLTGELLDVGQKRDDVVPRGLLDLEDARGVELAGGGRADRLGGARRDDRTFHRLADRQLDLEPELEPVSVVPQRGELGAAIASDHGRELFTTAGYLARNHIAIAITDAIMTARQPHTT